MSLLVWLPLNGSIKNLGLNGNINVINTNVTFDNTGKIGLAAVFNGTTSRLSINNFSIGNNWSYGFWFYSTSTDRGWESLLLLSNNSGDTDTQLGFYIHTTQTRMLSTANGQYNSNIPYTYTGKWTHMFATFNGTTLITYMNGIEVDRKTITAALLPRTHLVIGARSASTNGGQESATTFFAGKINDVRIYDHCLSDKEVEELSKGLVLHYKLNESNLNLLINYWDLTKWSKESGITVEWDETVLMYKVFDSSHTSSRWGIYQNITLSANTTYTFSVEGLKKDLTTSFGFAEGSSWPANAGSFTTTISLLSKTITVGANDANCRIYLNINPVTNGSNYGYFRAPKLELGNIVTPWTNNINNNIIYDSSGYLNNGVLNTSITVNLNTARYGRSSYFGNYNEPNVVLLNINILPALSNCTICWWGKYDTTKTLLLTGQNTSTYLAASNANTFYHAAAGSPVMYKNGVLGTYSCVAGTWDFYVLKNVNLSSWTAMKINSYGSGWPLKGYISDFRIYATALTDDLIKELYNTSVTIDNKGNIYSREYIEDNNNLNITKTGLFLSSIIHDDDDLTIASILKTEKLILGNTLYEY